MKNPQFSSNQYETWSKWSSHGWAKLPKFELDRPKIADFSLIPYFRASPIFIYSLSRSETISKYFSEFLWHKIGQNSRSRTETVKELFDSDSLWHKKGQKSWSWSETNKEISFLNFVT